MQPLSPNCTPISNLQCKGMARKLNLRPICVRSSDIGLNFDVFGLDTAISCLAFLQVLLSVNIVC